MMVAAAVILIALPAAFPQEPGAAKAGSDGSRQLIFLAENRPVFLRLRAMTGDRLFEESWIDSIRTLHASLDRNGDGKLTTKEADKAIVTALVRLAAGAAAPPNLGELDVKPKDGLVSIDELAEALRPFLGPFQLEVGRQAIKRTDALFDQLDRDKDGQLTRTELAAIAGSLRPLDLDDNEMISDFELEPYGSPALAAVLVDGASGRPGSFTASPPVVELVAGESSFRPARLLLKKYDKAKDDIPGRQDNKLSPEELAIDPDAFASADTNGNGMLDTEELRKYLAGMPVDVPLDVAFSSDSSGRATIRAAAGAAPLPKGAQVRQLGDGDVEVVIGQVRLDLHVQGGNSAAEEARRLVTQQFKAADANKNGYLEAKEQATINAPQAPLAGLLEVIDRDADGKIYLKELVEFIDRQSEAARHRMVVTTADQGRAIFGILDLDRDRRLGAREVMRTVDRVMSWDGDGDGRVSADEIPYHFLVNISRSGLAGLTGAGGGIPAPPTMDGNRQAGPALGPVWFQKMDRNHDGDVSRREFLGPREVFERLDGDTDGLMDPMEADADALPAGKAGAKKE